DRSQRQLSIAALGNLLGRFDDAWCGRWRYLRPYLVGCFDGNGADYLVKGTGSWPCDLSVRLAGTVHRALHAVCLLAGIDRHGRIRERLAADATFRRSIGGMVKCWLRAG